MSKSQLQSDIAQKLLAVCGITGSILFLIVVTLLGILQPGYNAITQFLSELGAVGAPYATVMDANFIVSGILIVAFAIGLNRGMGEEGSSKIGSALVVSSAAGLVGAGIFSCDPGCPALGGSFSQGMHNLVSLPQFIGAMLAPLIISRSLKEGVLQGYRTYSVLTGTVLLGTFLVLFLGLGLGFLPWLGAVQRFFFVMWFLWIVIIAIKLVRISSRSSV